MLVRALLVCGLVGTLTACTGPAPDSPAPERNGPTPGTAGIGDPYYPTDGNGGYDARAYDVSVRFDPESGRLDGDATITARATNALSRFNLDLHGLDVSSVEVDGATAEFSRRRRSELVVTPPEPLAEGSTFRTRVRYAGTPADAGSGQLGSNGWQRTSSGGAFVLGQPHSAAFWYPVNDHPRDKATFRLTAEVPEGWTAVSIGRRERSTTEGGWTTTTWAEPNPVASYLTTIAVDRFDVERGKLADGTPVLSAYAPGAGGMRDEGARVGEVIDFLTGEFGEYPQATAGGIYLGEDIGYSLETQGRPTYTRSADLLTVVHELAHQWWGNTVSIRSWADICLNECLASYSQWLWAEGKEGDHLDDRYRRAVNRYAGSDTFWGSKLYDMGAGHEFEGVYSKGILALHAVRRQIGDEAFSRVLREFPARHRNGNASWPQFEDFIERVSGQRLDDFFDAWFRGTEQPAGEYLYPGTLRR